MYLFKFVLLMRLYPQENKSIRSPQVVSGELLENDDLELELREVPPRLVKRESGSVVTDGWWIAVSGSLLCFLMIGAESTYQLFRHDIWKGDKPGPLFVEVCFKIILYVCMPLTLLSWLSTRLNAVRRTNAILRDGVACTATVLGTCDRRRLAYWIKHSDRMRTSSKAGSPRRHKKNDGRLDREIESREYLLSRAVERQLIQEAEMAESAALAELAERLSKGVIPGKLKPYRIKSLSSGSGSSGGLFDQGELIRDRPSLPSDDYWGISPAWDTSTYWFAIYEFVANDSRKVIGCLAVNRRDSRSGKKFFETGDRVSILYEPSNPYNHIVFQLVNEFKIKRRSFRRSV